MKKYKKLLISGLAILLISSCLNMPISYAEEQLNAPSINRETFTTYSPTCYQNNIVWDYNGCEFYKVYRSENENDNYKLIAKVNITGYQDKNVISGKTYYYKISSCKGEIESPMSESVCITTLEKPKTKLPTPKLIGFIQRQYNRIDINWKKQANTSDGEVYGYKIYRATSKNGKYTKINEGEFCGTTAIDRNVLLGTTYYYKIKAYKWINGVKIYSNFSNIISAKTTLKTPKISLINGSKKVTIKWNSLKSHGAQGYEIYRSTRNNGKYSKIKSTTGTTYTNTGLKKGKKYYYKIRAYRVVKGKKIYSKYSSIKSIKSK